MYVIKFTALLMCIIAVKNLGTSGLSLIPDGFGFITDRLKPLTDPLLDMTFTGIKIGGKLVRLPLIGTESLFQTSTALAGFGQDLISKIAEGVQDGLDQGWEAVETFEAVPGVQYVMLFPNAAAAIVDKTLDTVSMVSTLTGRALTAAEAMAVNTAAHVITTTLGLTMRTLGMDCFKLNHIDQHIGKTLVEDMHARDVRICGLSNLRPDNNVTITEEDESFQVIKVNFWIRNMKVTIKSMDVSDYSDDPVLKNTPMTVNIEKTKVVGFLEFNKGTLLKFITIRLRVVKFQGFKIHIKVKKSRRTNMMDMVEGISDILGKNVKESINKRFAKWEKRISRALTGK